MIFANHTRTKGVAPGRLAGVLVLLAVPALLAAAGEASAALKLDNASVSRLDNGLTVILLEDRNFAVASVQMHYRVGARNEVSGRTGLAHFLEHMAFRDSENFPGTELVSSIYAAGGEWHGYTWLDQTTYYATVPKARLDLLLRIEADRMMRLELSPGDMEAERGAVLAEMHMYENSPKSMLIDALMSTSFLTHPYRNNTIGWQSDIEHLEHAAVLEFYRRHYHPANAVLAVVGDFERGQVLARIEELFGDYPRRASTPLPHAREAGQRGERRLQLVGGAGDRQFMIGYRAPAVSHPDYAAFLVLQEIVGAGSGVSFLQNDWGTPIADGSLLDGAADGMTTWYPPGEQDFLFVIGGHAPAGKSERAVEEGVEQRIASLRRRGVSEQSLSAAIARVRDELVYDVETTEDAAHQLAFFAGLHALDVLLTLPERVSAVTADDVRRLAASWLLPERRTIAWRLPGPTRPDERRTFEPVPGVAEREPAAAIDAQPLPEPVVRKLGGGVPVIVQASDLSPSVHLRIVLPGGRRGAPQVTEDDPLTGYSSLSARVRPGRLPAALEAAHRTMSGMRGERTATKPLSGDPATRLEQAFSEFMGGAAAADGPVSPALIVVSGDVHAGEAIAMLERQFGRLAPSMLEPAVGRGDAHEPRVVRLGSAVAQARLGYIVPVPGPRDAGYEASRLLLYILSHDYEGRFGKAAISERGLAYYVDSRYRSNGRNGWATLAVGVDTEKIDALRDLMSAELQRLLSEAPTVIEIEQAKSHFSGRARSAAQSNAELTAALARQWLQFGEIVTPDALDRRLAAVTRADVLDAVPGFIAGSLIEVRE